MKLFLILFGLVGLLAMLFASSLFNFGSSSYLIAVATIAVAAMIFSKRLRRALLQIGSAACALIILAGLFMTGSPPANAADPIGLYAASPTVLTNIPAFVNGGAQSNITSQIFTYSQEKGFGVFADYWGTNAATVSAGTLRFAPGYMVGTNYYWCTTNLMEATFTANGTSTNRGFVNFAPPTWKNFSHFKLLNMTNANASTNKLYFTNIVVSVGS